MTVRCDNCAYLRRRTSHYYDDLTCLMGEKPNKRPKECDFYEPKEVKCPKCNADITYLQAFSFEQSKYRVQLDEHGLIGGLFGPDWSVRLDTKIEFNCPECDETLFTNHDGNYPQSVIDFLNKGKVPEASE